MLIERPQYIDQGESFYDMERGGKMHTVILEDPPSVIVGVIGLIDVPEPHVPKGNQADRVSCVHLSPARVSAGLFQQVDRRYDQQPDKGDPVQDLVDEQRSAV